MKTENTLRTVRNSLLCFFMALGAGFLVACGGGGGGGVSSNGTFHASDWVVGLDYTLDNGQTGKTGARGAFSFEKGQTVVFSIGQVTLGNFVSNADEDFVTPTRIEGGGTFDATDVEQLLIALDSGSGGNGTIVLDENSATDAVVVMSVIAARDIDSERTLPVDNADISVAVARTIPTETEAGGLLSDTNNCAFSGAFEGTWQRPDDDESGDTALVLLAFNSEPLGAVNNPVTAQDAGTKLNQIGDGGDNSGSALYVNLWKQGGGSQSSVDDFGSDSGLLAINLNAFPVSLDIEVEDGTTITLMVESYDKMTYTSAQETGVYRRVNGEVRDADYRIAGFYSDADNDQGEAEIGIFAFSANKGGGSVRPYVGWFSSPLSDSSGSPPVYSNIGEGGLSPSVLRYTGTPESGAMTFTEDDGSSFTVDSFTNIDSRGYGTYEEDTGDDGEIESLVGGWCAL